MRRFGRARRTPPAARPARLRRSLWAASVTVVLLIGSVSAVSVRPELGLHHAAPVAPHAVPYGAFLGSGADGVQAVDGFSAWSGGTATVGRTYLPGTSWQDIDGSQDLLAPWTAWRAADPKRMLVVDVPMLEPNEPPLPDAQVVALLRQGGTGAFDVHFKNFGQQLVDGGAPDAVLILGWEMNSINYTGRCDAAPAAWKAYYRHLVGVLRSVPGQHFKFDFNPDRGPDAVPWSDCYPGDDVVDVIGMDSYDQPPGKDFAQFADGPYGLQDQADFAAAHGKPISFPEWGLFRFGDDPAYVTSMLHWISTHDTLYETIADYCQVGVWHCSANPRSSSAFLAGIHPASG
jgi:hypothetical protein